MFLKSIKKQICVVDVGIYPLLKHYQWGLNVFFILCSDGVEVQPTGLHGP